MVLDLKNGTKIIMKLDTNHYLILRILEHLPDGLKNPTSAQIGRCLTDINKVWIVKKHSVASHLGNLRRQGLVGFMKIYEYDRVPYRIRYNGGYTSMYPFHTEWYITERGRYVLANSAS